MFTRFGFSIAFICYCLPFLMAQSKQAFQLANKQVLTDNAFMNSSFSSNLWQIQQAYLAAEQEGTVANFQPSIKGVQVVDASIQISLSCSPDKVNGVLKNLKELGLKNEQLYKHQINGLFPLKHLSKLNEWTAIQTARPVYRPHTHSGIVESQGDVAQRSDIIRLQNNLSGSGITVGVLSDSYNSLGGEALGISNGELPGLGNATNSNPVTILLDDIFPSNIDEGRAMLEIVHDVAPQANLAFHTALGGPAAFANGILALEQFGCEVIVDDIGYFSSPFFQDGVIAQAVTAVVNDGAVYLSSAGNQGRLSYEAPLLANANITVGGVPYVAHDFGGNDILQSISIPPFSDVTIVLQWDQPFFSATGQVGSNSNVDLFLVNAAETSVLASSTTNNIGGDALEILQFSNTTNITQSANILIGLREGPTPTLIKYLVFGDLFINEFPTNSSTCVGQPNSAEALGVGAAFWAATPPFGISPPLLESFSSAGGTPILFATDGTRLNTPLILNKPDFTGPDGGNTSFFGGDSNFDADLFPNFFGTSASAPHVAALVALLLEAQPNATPQDIKAALTSTAIDMGPLGFDFDSGAGFIDAVAALSALVPIQPEICDGIDNDNDGLIDDEDPDVINQQTWFLDFDNDGFGDANNSILACSQPDGFVENDLDCNDTNNAINPNAVEICDGIDNNCDGNFEPNKLELSYIKTSFTTNEANPSPIVLTLNGGVFSSTPAGLSINTNTGEVDLSNSIPGIYNISYSINTICIGTVDVLFEVLPTSNLVVNVDLQGRNVAEGIFTIDLFEAGTSNLIESIVQAADLDGSLTILDLQPGTYDLLLDREQYLSRSFSNISLNNGENTVDFTIATGHELRGGDANNDNFVTALDFSILANTFNLALGDPNYDERADLNGDDFITALDFSILASNFNTSGDVQDLEIRNNQRTDYGWSQKDQVQLQIVPQEEKVNISTPIFIDLIVHSGSQAIDATGLQLRFNPDMLHIKEIQWEEGFELILQESVDTEQGIIALAAGTLQTPPSGTFTLARILVEPFRAGDISLVLAGLNGKKPELTDDGHVLELESSPAFLTVDQISSTAITLNAFPIPAKNKLTILANAPNSQDEINLRLFDFNGKVVWQNEYKNQFETSIEVSGFPAGIYILEGRSNNLAERIRIVIQ